jgi:hypothetical protein
VALVSVMVSQEAYPNLRNWIGFVEPDIGIFGLSQGWTLPSRETKPLAHGYHDMSGNNLTSPFGTVNLVNLGSRQLTRTRTEPKSRSTTSFIHARTKEAGPASCGASSIAARR